MFLLLLPVFLLQSTIICSGKDVTVGLGKEATVGLDKEAVVGVASSTSLQSVANKNEPVPCTCGIFLTGQFVKGSPQQPYEGPVLLHEHDHSYSCSALGRRQCANKCLEVIAKHLPQSPGIICASIDRDCFKERAYLWTKNCKDVWENSKMSAGREFCCKNNLPYKCSLGKQ